MSKGPQGEEDEIFTVRDVAKMLKLTEKGIYGLTESRQLPHYKLSNRIRFSRKEVLEWLEAKKVTPLNPTNVRGK